MNLTAIEFREIFHTLCERIIREHLLDTQKKTLRRSPSERELWKFKKPGQVRDANFFDLIFRKANIERSHFYRKLEDMDKNSKSNVDVKDYVLIPALSYLLKNTYPDTRHSDFRDPSLIVRELLDDFSKADKDMLISGRSLSSGLPGYPEEKEILHKLVKSYFTSIINSDAEIALNMWEETVEKRNRSSAFRLSLAPNYNDIVSINNISLFDVRFGGRGQDARPETCKCVVYFVARIKKYKISGPFSSRPPISRGAYLDHLSMLDEKKLEEELTEITTRVFEPGISDEEDEEWVRMNFTRESDRWYISYEQSW